MENKNAKLIPFLGLAGADGVVGHEVSIQSILATITSYIAGILIIIAIVLILSDLIPAVWRLFKRKK